MLAAAAGYWQALGWDFGGVLDGMLDRPDMQLVADTLRQGRLLQPDMPGLFKQCAGSGVDVRAMLRQQIVKDLEKKFITVILPLFVGTFPLTSLIFMLCYVIRCVSFLPGVLNLALQRAPLIGRQYLGIFFIRPAV